MCYPDIPGLHLPVEYLLVKKMKQNQQAKTILALN